MKKTTHIRIEIRVKNKLKKLKVHPRQSYSEVIEGLLKLCADRGFMA